MLCIPSSVIYNSCLIAFYSVKGLLCCCVNKLLICKNQLLLFSWAKRCCIWSPSLVNLVFVPYFVEQTQTPIWQMIDSSDPSIGHACKDIKL